MTDLLNTELDRLEAALKDLQRVTEQIRLAQEELERKRRQQFLDEARAEQEIERQRMEAQARKAADEALLEVGGSVAEGEQIMVEIPFGPESLQQRMLDYHNQVLNKVQEALCPKGPKL